MAIYHLNAKIISRKAGRSATAAAAYRAGEKIVDERTGEVHDYRRKGGVEHTEIVLPSSSDWEPTRTELWNAVELKNKRQDAQVVREFVVALPDELAPVERRQLAVDFAREIADHYSVAADVAMHAPSRHGDDRNHHAHILTTTNRVEGHTLGNKARELDLVAHNMGGKLGQANEIDRLRERWAELTNTALERSGVAKRVDHRSLKEQGTERAPTRHLGPAATGYERRTGEASRKRLDFEREAAERLARARQAGELERQSHQAERSILDLSGDLRAAKAERDRQPTPDILQAAAAGVADFRAKFEAMKLAEAGKQQAREVFEQFKTEQESRRQAEQARQQAAELAAVQTLAKRQSEQEAMQKEKKQSHEREQARKQGREQDGPSWSR